MLDLRTLRAALGGEISGGRLLCPGPGHSASDRSLSIKIDLNAPDGFLCHSFAGDDPLVCKDYAREKLGLPAFKPNGGNGRGRASDDAIAAALMAAVQNNKPKGRLVATFDYNDDDGTLLYQVLKYNPKAFRQRRPNGNGGWIWDLGDVRRVLYRRQDLLTFLSATVFITEGEKDADRLASLDLVATTVAHGKWTDECIQLLAGRHIMILEDNDKAGRKKAREVATLLHGIADTIRIVRLPNLAEGGDVSDWLDADPRRAEKLVDVCFDAAVWTPDEDTADTADATDNSATKEESKSGDPPLPFINIGAWQNRPVPEREWTIKDRIPGKNVTLLSGEGSIGKSILSLHLATAVVLGRDWLQSLPDPGPALVACCEDDVSEIWRRLDLIFAHYGAAYTDFEDLHVLALAGEETLMATPDRKGIVQPTKLFIRIRDAALDIKPRLVVLDNSADIFGGNENDRAQVRQFIGILRGMAIAAGTGVLLTSHPSLTGISSGSGLSGSTAWNASVRSRLYFKRAVTDKDEEPDPDLRVLEVMKTNYGRPGETITLKWNNGLFLPVGGISNLEKLAAEQKADHLFLALLNRFNGQGRNTSERSSANNYAPTLFAKENEAKELGIKKVNFEDAMRRLFAANKIRLEPYGAPSKGTARLVCCGPA
jgi:RecA-family ATPase